MNDVYLLLGSNLGDRNLFMQQATNLIAEQISPVVQASSVYETQSWGKSDAPDYLNQVILLRTDMPARLILEKILAIEIVLGRKREEKWGSRTIDIDILFYGDEVINDPDLQVPHPQLHNRWFTLEPLSEIVPDFKHKSFKMTVMQLKKALKDDLIVKKFYF